MEGKKKDGKAIVLGMYKFVYAVLALALSFLDNSGPGTETCFDALALSLLLSRSLSVNVHAKRLPLMSTHRLISNLVPAKSIAVNENVEAD